MSYFAIAKLGLLFNANEDISNLTGMGITDETSLIAKAIAVGAKEAIAKMSDVYSALPHDVDGNYTGTYHWDLDIMNFVVDHGTQPGEDARGCVDCHAESGGILDWESLGYEENPYPIVTSVDNEDSSIPSEFELKQNYPNPFNPTTTIEFAIPNRTNVVLKVYNDVGQIVETLVDLQLAPGNYSVDFNAGHLASGVYFYRLETAEFTQSKKLVLMK